MVVISSLINFAIVLALSVPPSIVIEGAPPPGPRMMEPATINDPPVM